MFVTPTLFYCQPIPVPLQANTSFGNGIQTISNYILNLIFGRENFSD